ncbi:hypothetical protein VspSTUT11_17450 [Vibrio sp. STUT-A11]|nr:hypothetical protein VspSTUT11_17450 [Vibrio sp. STUT-A11]
MFPSESLIEINASDKPNFSAIPDKTGSSFPVGKTENFIEDEPQLITKTRDSDDMITSRANKF